MYYTDWMTLEGSQLESYWLLRRNSLLADAVNTLGVRFERKGDSWDSNLEVSGQLGDFQGMQHRALAAHGGVGRNWDATRLGVAYNYASGDSDPNDNRHGTFDNLYPTNHKFYGYMDLFAWQNLHNFETTFKWKMRGWAARIAYHAFWLPEAGTDAWYNAGGGVVRKASSEDVSAYVGSEADVTVSQSFWDGRVGILVGYSHFVTGSYVSETGADENADYLFFQTKLMF